MLIQNFLDDFKINNKNDKVFIYGAGEYGTAIFAQNDLSGINIVGYADKKFENLKNYVFLKIPAFSPSEIENLDYDTLFVFLKKPECIKDIIASAKKAGKKVIYFNDSEFPFNKYNRIILVQDGEEKEITEKELPQGFELIHNDTCRNNLLKIELPQFFSKLTISFHDVTNCCCEIMSSLNAINNTTIHFGQGSDMKIRINRNVSIVSASIFTNQTGSEIELGEDCMLASGILITGGDGHTIIDRTTGKVINAQKHKLYIGNHVWIGDYARVLKNAVIPDGSIVGSNAVVTKKYDEPNIILAGNPAKIVRHNILWTRDTIKTLDNVQ